MVSVHNGSMLRRLSTRVGAVVTVGVLTGALASCSGSDAEPVAQPTASDSETPSATATVEETPYLAVPEDVELTEQGSELEVGDTATVAWQPDRKTIGVLDVTVNRLEKTTFKQSFQGWKLDKETRESTPYFVRVTVENTGKSQLGGNRVPLYVVDGRNTLIESSTFSSKFKPCPSTSLPKKFGSGRSQKVCLVYLAPDGGKLTAVSFRPTQEFNPIVWTGDVKNVGAEKKEQDKKEQQKKAPEKQD